MLHVSSWKLRAAFHHAVVATNLLTERDPPDGLGQRQNPRHWRSLDHVGLKPLVSILSCGKKDLEIGNVVF